VTHDRNHPVCGGCYIEKVSARLPRSDAIVYGQRCCRCNRPVSVLLYWHTPPMWMFVPYCPDVGEV
jgi:hypothetical protein